MYKFSHSYYESIKKIKKHTAAIYGIKDDNWLKTQTRQDKPDIDTPIFHLIRKQHLQQ